MSRARWLAIVVLAAGAAAMLSWVAASSIRSPAASGIDADAPEPTPIAVPVERLELRDDIVARGVVELADSVTVTVGATTPSGELAVVTELARSGTQIDEGSLLAMVSDRPIIALRSALPLFGPLEIGDRGSDIAELRAALVRLGLLDTVGDTFDTATREALGGLYERVGSRLPAGPVPVEDFRFFDRLPLRVVEVTAQRGDLGPADLLVVAPGDMTVTVSIDPAEASLVGEGSPATVLATRTGVSVTGSVISFEPDGQQVLATVGLDPGAGFSIVGESVRATLPVEQRASAGPVMAVPVAALVTDVHGETVVAVVDQADTITPRSVRVLPGLVSRGGLVEVTALDGDLDEGDLVVVGTDPGLDLP